MTIIMKIFGTTTAVVLSAGAIFFGAASIMSLCAPDPNERRDATISVIWSMAIVAMCVAIIVGLSGCQAAKTIIDTCRDGLCR